MSAFTDDIPAARHGGGAKLVERLSNAQHLPVDAMDAAIRRPDRIADAVLDVVTRAAQGEPLSSQEGNLLFWGIHVLGEVRETRLLPPLLRLVRRLDDDMLELMLGDTVTLTLSRIVVSTYDGDLRSLADAIADREADGFVRWSLLNALAYLTFAQAVPREAASDLLVRFDDERWAAGGDPAWVGWEEAVALLGFTNLADRVAAARRDARLLDDVSDPEWFALTLADAAAKPDDRARFDDKDLGPVVDVVAELDRALASDGEGEPEAPVVNPLRDVGRNDPCPCGSGKKYKKCCLAA